MYNHLDLLCLLLYRVCQFLRLVPSIRYHLCIQQVVEEMGRKEEYRASYTSKYLIASYLYSYRYFSTCIYRQHNKYNTVVEIK